MKYLGNLYAPRTQQAADRVKSADYLRVRGTNKQPAAPVNLQAQPGPRGIFLTWTLPALSTDIAGWRVYKGDENTLYHSTQDRGTRQVFVESTAGDAPPTINLFVSSINNLGVESLKVQTQGAAATETGAPVMPGVPPGYNQTAGGGGNRGTGGAGGIRGA